MLETWTNHITPDALISLLFIACVWVRLISRATKNRVAVCLCCHVNHCGLFDCILLDKLVFVNFLLFNLDNRIYIFYTIWTINRAAKSRIFEE